MQTDDYAGLCKVDLGGDSNERDNGDDDDAADDADAANEGAALRVN